MATARLTTSSSARVWTSWASIRCSSPSSPRSDSSMASTAPFASLIRIRMSMIRMIPASWSFTSSSAPSPVKFWCPAGNSTIR